MEKTAKMRVDGRNLRPIWPERDSRSVSIIDQRRLPHELSVEKLKTAEEAITAIREMMVRGAPLIGVTGAYGVYLAALEHPDPESLARTCQRLRAARPTAVNLAWAVDRTLSAALGAGSSEKTAEAALREADAIAEEEASRCCEIGRHGLSLIEEISRGKKGRTVNLLTHCNAGWLASVEYGMATAPMYAAFDRGVDIHVWVDETRPLNQGNRLTAWELGKHGVRHTVITDNAGGHLMQHGQVDMVIVGADRVTRTGDVANKIGTYLKALAARDNGIPFYVAIPSSTIDWHLRNGLAEIPIEERNPDEVRYVYGFEAGKIRRVLVLPPESPAANFAFDVTPSRLVTGLITERGICGAGEEDIMRLFPEKKTAHPSRP